MRSAFLFSQFAKFYKKSPNAFFEETERNSYVFLALSVPKIRFALSHLRERFCSLAQLPQFEVV
jgi:hypothetical protein